MASPDVLTGLLKLFSCDAYYLLDLGSTLSYVTPFLVVHFGFGSECVSDLFYVSTSIGNIKIARNIYKGCVVSIDSKETLVDLFELDTVDFDIMLRMDW